MIRLLLIPCLLSALIGCGGITATVAPDTVSTALADGTRLVVLKLPAMV
jgi:hypothetical protein